MKSGQAKRRRWRTSAEMQQRAREFRKAPTRAEAILWERLRNRRLNGLKFRRQHPIGPYIVDFYCAQHRLIVEIDGPVHRLQAEHDRLRAEELERRGYRILRVTNEEVERDIEGVLKKIAKACGLF